MPKKKKYYVTADVTKAAGWQTMVVMAESAEEALALVNSGEGEFHDQEVEVTDLDEWAVSGCVDE